MSDSYGAHDFSGPAKTNSIEAGLRQEIERLNQLNKELAERLAAASEALSQRACLKLEPDRGHPGFRTILKEIWQQHLSKSSDYGTDADPLDNIHSVAECGIEPWVYAYTCAMEASRRVRNHLNGRKQLSGAKLSNALLDAASWSILSELERRSKQGTE